MENIFIKDAPIIKEVKLNKEVLEKFKKGVLEKNLMETTFLTEIIEEEKKVQELKDKLNSLNYEKNELQDLIVKGNSGLIGKVIESQKNILAVEKELKLAEESLQDVKSLEGKHTYNLEEALYRNFIDNGALVKEHKNNAEALQLKLYSLLYQAFEVEMALKDLSNEYYYTVRNEFNNYKPHKSFFDTFPYVSFINEVKQNFPGKCNHINNYSQDYIYRFVEKLEGCKKDKSITLYK